MWIARNKNHELRLFYGSEEPVRGEISWIDAKEQSIKLPDHLLPEIKWEDDAPAYIALVYAADREFDEAFNKFLEGIVNDIRLP